MAGAERIFISYRSADGRDKATALARDLGKRFGDHQVFLDKDDLRGGSAWRAELQRTLGSRPVLLLLVTPQLLDAVDAQGRRRIEDADDPVRRELQGALASGGQVVPVLCDGVDAAPAAATLPPPFDRLGELTWRRLRAYDWPHDVARLCDDLHALGVQAGPPAPPWRRRAWLAGGVGTAAALALWFIVRPAGPPAGLSGDWQATLVRGERTRLQLQQDGDRLTLASAPVPLAGRADWDDYRAFWRQRFGSELQAVVYRGQGQVITAPGVAPRIDVALQLLASPGDELVDSGNLSARLDPSGRRLEGKIWLNSAQADWPALLER